MLSTMYEVCRFLAVDWSLDLTIRDILFELIFWVWLTHTFNFLMILYMNKVNYILYLIVISKVWVIAQNVLLKSINISLSFYECSIHSGVLVTDYWSWFPIRVGVSLGYAH